MNAWIKWLLVAVPVAVAAFFLGPVLWTHDAMELSGMQTAGFMVISAVESIAFGVGVAFLVYGIPHVKHSRRGMLAPFISLAWLIVSWWPHDNFHASIGMNVNALLALEYVFHLTNIIAVLIVARYFWQHLSAGSERRDDDVKRGGFEVWK